MPILYVAHDKADSMWQFLCGQSHKVNERMFDDASY